MYISEGGNIFKQPDGTELTRRINQNKTPGGASNVSGFRSRDNNTAMTPRDITDLVNAINKADPKVRAELLKQLQRNPTGRP